MTTQYKLALLIFSVISLPLIDKINVNKFFHIVVFLFFIILISDLLNKLKSARWMIGLLSFGLASSNSLIITSHYIYGEEFSEGMAASIINTNAHEALSMLQVVWPGVIAFIAILWFYHVALRSIRLNFKYKNHITSVIVAFVVASNLMIVFYTNRFGTENRVFSRILNRTPFYPYATFSDAIYNINQLKSTKVDFNHVIENKSEAYKTIVVVIGESAIRSRMSIYGSERNTTPNMLKIKSNLILFSNAVAPSSYTLLSVPLTLAYPALNIDDLSTQTDSVILLANHLGYKTYWLSTQGKSGIHTNTITIVGEQSTYSKWISGPDFALIDEYKSVIESKDRKMIFLHLNGSHEPVCSSANNVRYFSGGDAEDDCYDNTLIATDDLIKSLIDNLPPDSVLLYYSDHALIKRNGQYIHSTRIPTKTAVEVPMFMWSASYKERHKNIKNIKTEYSTAQNYHLIADLLGVVVSTEKCESILLGCGNKKVDVLDTYGKVHGYKSLE